MDDEDWAIAVMFNGAPLGAVQFIMAMHIDNVILDGSA
jgi:hypothetical protein